MFYSRLIVSLLLLLLFSCGEKKQNNPIGEYILKKTGDDTFKEKGYILLPANACTGCTKFLIPKIVETLEGCANYKVIVSVKSESFRRKIRSEFKETQLIIDEIGELDRVKGVSQMLVCEYDENGILTIKEFGVDNYKNMMDDVLIGCK